MERSWDTGEGMTRADAIAGAIRRAVIEHRLPPGMRLSEDQIGLIFGASRTIVRSALQALAHDHIVTLAKNRGASVASPSVEDARHLFDARRTLEGDLVQRAATRMTPALASSLADLIEQGHRALAAADRGAAIRLSGEFHLALADTAAQPVLRGFLGELISRSSLVIALYGRERSVDCGEDAHRDLLAAVLAGQGGRAATLMREHLHHIEAGLDLERDGRAPVSLGDVFFAQVLASQVL